MVHQRLHHEFTEVWIQYKVCSSCVNVKCWYVQMSICQNVDMSKWRYVKMSICLNVVMSKCWYFKMSKCWYVKMLICQNVDMSKCRCLNMLICQNVDMSKSKMSICQNVDIPFEGCKCSFWHQFGILSWSTDQKYLVVGFWITTKKKLKKAWTNKQTNKFFISIS